MSTRVRLPSDRLAATAVASSPAKPASAVLTVARAEWTAMRRDRRFGWALGLLLALLAVGALLGWQRALQVEAEHTAAREASYAQWLDQGDKNPHGAAHFGQYAFKPPSALAFVDPGVAPYVGVTTWMEAHKRNDFRFRPARDATALQRFGDLSVGFVLQVLAPLLVVLLGFPAFSGERERGTLKLLLGQGVRARDLLLGKALALAGLLAVVLLPLAVIGMGAALAWPDEHAAPRGDLLARAAGLGAGYLVYLLGFVALTLAVSARAASSRQALVLLLAFWVLNAFVAPRLAGDIARSVFPSPSAAAFQSQVAAEIRASFSGHDEAHPGFQAFKKKLLDEHGVDRLEELPQNFRGLALQQGEENGYRVFDKHHAALAATEQRQRTLAVVLGAALPRLALQPASMGFAASDGAHQRHFADAAEGYRRVIQKAMNDDIANFSRYGDANYKAGRALWQQVPPFAYAPPPAAWAWARQAQPLAALGLWALLCGVFALRAADRLRAV
ncbi:MAG TPA: DUF3526 domain-containing protein [Methylibium sp.]|uniref:DUF3526 domain-containing protein n=1 Tax=Methylibium sp. TaxID=2067992 RepID=UPI002DB7651C|nr:DUF3526 domain-containing protein [Methylibium sp.]HEU4458021.1 DUF3526 domain-containing protein [Methylibium sp.]